jgi:hypothetical protein
MFGDEHAVANAGLVLAGLLSEKRGLEEHCDKTISITPFPGGAPRRSWTHWSSEEPAATTPTYWARVRRRQCWLTG